MSYNILILFAHPRFERSRTNQILVEAIPQNSEISFRDLYELYPDFNVNIREEKQLLLDHDIIIWQHPLYWYSTPPLLKQWIDMVLEFGWAYGPGGEALKGKLLFNAFSSGGARQTYRRDGRNRFSIEEFFVPFEQTAKLCHMEYLPPFAVQGTHRLTDAELRSYGDDYAALLLRLIRGDFSLEEMRQHPYLNDWLYLTQTTNS